MTFQPVDAGTRIGHVHLKVADLSRAIHFYHDVLGFEVVQRLGDSAAFLSAGGYHHHIALNTWESAGARRPLREPLDFIMSPSSSLRARLWRTRCAG